ncbi:hypothetical protein AALA44_02760 [Enterococcus ratti]|uniref:hypothetical protein n=1 Tax=Enterococcus ratti TaxID=150033 RepID=UPI003518DBF6
MNEKTLLIYGLTEERKKYAKSIGFSLNEESENNFYINASPFYIDFYNDEIENVLISEELKRRNNPCLASEENFTKFSKEWINYIDQSTKHWPLWYEYFQVTQLNPKNELKTIYKEESKEEYWNTSLHIKRGCKIGLELAKFIPDLEIHFCLDGIDIQDVIAKAQDKSIYGGSITSSELRYIYRNWEYLKKSVIFIEQNQKVEAPWIRDPVSWKKYVPKSQLLKKEEVTQQANKSNQSEAITKTNLFLKKGRGLCGLMNFSKCKSYHLNDHLKKVESKEKIKPNLSIIWR